MTDKQRANNNAMKALTPFTKLKPDERFKQSSKVISLFNQSSNILKVGDCKTMQGYQLPSPPIGMREEAVVTNGKLECRGILLEPHRFQK